MNSYYTIISFYFKMSNTFYEYCMKRHKKVHLFYTGGTYAYFGIYYFIHY